MNPEGVINILSIAVVKVGSFPPTAFKILFCLWFYNVPKCDLFCFVFPGLAVSVSQICGFVSVSHFGICLPIILQIFHLSLSFSSLLGFQFAMLALHCYCPTAFGFFIVFFILFSLYLSVCVFLLISSYLILSLTRSSLMMSPLKALHFCYHVFLKIFQHFHLIVYYSFHISLKIIYLILNDDYLAHQSL